MSVISKKYYQPININSKIKSNSVKLTSTEKPADEMSVGLNITRMQCKCTLLDS